MGSACSCIRDDDSAAAAAAAAQQLGRRHGDPTAFDWLRHGPLLQLSNEQLRAAAESLRQRLSPNTLVRGRLGAAVVLPPGTAPSQTSTTDSPSSLVSDPPSPTVGAAGRDAYRRGNVNPLGGAPPTPDEPTLLGRGEVHDDLTGFTHLFGGGAMNPVGDMPQLAEMRLSPDDLRDAARRLRPRSPPAAAFVAPVRTEGLRVTPPQNPLWPLSPVGGPNARGCGTFSEELAARYGCPMTTSHDNPTSGEDPSAECEDDTEATDL